MITLKPYQQDAIDAINQTFEERSRQYVVMPTGSGKTITFLSFCQSFNKILVVVPSIQLMEQVYDSALLFMHHSYISRKGDYHFEKPKKLHICVAASLKHTYRTALTEEDFDLIIIDEAHHSQSAIYRRLINAFSKTKILGVTATPDRADGRLLNEILEFRSYDLDILSLIENGHLSDIEGCCIKTNDDISNIDTHNGEYSLNQLYKRLGTASRNNLIKEIYLNELSDRKTLVFCINIKHSKEVCKVFTDNGIAAAHIDGTMPFRTKQIILDSFREGNIKVLCNCQLLTEGFDEPSIDGIILARPTTSRALFIQMIGRGLRIHPGKRNCKIVDIVDAHKTRQGFSSLIGDEFTFPIDGFMGIADIKDRVDEHKEAFELKSEVDQVDKEVFLNHHRLHNFEATSSMYRYLKDNNVEYYDPLSFDEASFLIWYNELKKDYYGNHYKNR